MLCIPKMAACGALMMGVESIEPKIPPLVMVNVPPCIWSIVSLFSFANVANRTTSASTWAKDIFCAARMTGTTKPRGAETAIDTSQSAL